MKIRRAVIPVAGLGTRFLPATKALAKEMLPIVDRPCIEYIVEEAVNSGIEEIVLVTRKGKKALEDHFDIAFELEHRLRQKNKNAELERLKKLEKMAKFVYVRQDQPLGDGHAILSAKELLCHEPFAVLFGDDIYDSKTPVLAQLIEQYNRYQAPVVALQKVPKKEISKYGVITPVNSKDGVHEIGGFIEKPPTDKAPSNLALTGKYIVTPDLMRTLVNTERKQNQELKLIDAMVAHTAQNKAIYGVEVEGKRFDTGSKLGFLQATVHFGLKNEKLGPEFKKHLKEVVNGF